LSRDIDIIGLYIIDSVIFPFPTSYIKVYKIYNGIYFNIYIKSCFPSIGIKSINLFDRNFFYLIAV